MLVGHWPQPRSYHTLADIQIPEIDRVAASGLESRRYNAVGATDV